MYNLKPKSCHLIISKFFAFIFLVFCLSLATQSHAGTYDHDDVLIIVNDNSATSTEIGEYFRTARGMSADQVIHINAQTSETVSRAEFETNIRTPVEDYITTNDLTDSINYLVTTKGVPLRVNGDPDNGDDNRASVDQELMLILGSNSAQIGVTGSYTNPYYTNEQSFSRADYDMYLVTRLTAYTINQVKSLIDRSSFATTTNTGNFVLDVDPNRDTGSYQQANDWMRTAETTLTSGSYTVLLDESTAYITDQANLLGYYSWGSNDCCDLNNGISNNTYVNGSIAETVVSSSGRTFEYPPTYGQSLIADLIAEGVTGVAGYTTEPYVNAIANADILFDRYTKGYNLAESFSMSTNHVSWKQVVVGDPKMVTVKEHPFNITSPVNNSLSTSTTLTFTWEEMEAYSGLDYYDLYIDDTLVETSINSESVTISTPLSTGNHIWFVVGNSNDGGQATSSSEFTLNIYPTYVQGDMIYIDNILGSDSANSGSSDEPFATINKATDIAMAGDTIVVIKNDGVPYREEVTASNSGDTDDGQITIRGVDAQNKPEIWASDDISGGWSSYGGGNPNTYQKVVSSSVNAPTFAAGPTITNLSTRDKGSSEDALEEGEWFYTGGVLFMRAIGAEVPNTLHIEFSTRDYGVNVEEYTSLLDLVVKYAGNAAFYLKSNTVATRLEAHYNSNGIQAISATDVDISYSLATNNQSYGFYLLVEDSNITNSTAYQNEGGLILVLLADNTEVRNNYFFENTLDVNAIFGASPPTGLSISNNAWSNPSGGTWDSYLSGDNQAEITTQSPNASSSDFSLTSSSTLINAGYDTGLAYDLLGNSINGNQDIGAFEYQLIPPTTSFTYTLSSKQIILSGTASDSDGSIVTKLWNFGDGATSESLNPSHTYTDYGSYTVTFTTVDNHQAETVESKIINITRPSSGGGGGGGGTSIKTSEDEIVYSCNDELAINYTETSAQNESPCLYEAADLLSSSVGVQEKINILLKQIEVLKERLNFLKAISPDLSSSNSSKNCLFPRNLDIRMTGEDVMCLQQYLNSNGFTITEEGPGSLGKETEYFGLLTQQALIEFQNAHVVEILTPNNLTYGTGYFGQSTRSYLNSN